MKPQHLTLNTFTSYHYNTHITSSSHHNIVKRGSGGDERREHWGNGRTPHSWPSLSKILTGIEKGAVIIRLGIKDLSLCRCAHENAHAHPFTTTLFDLWWWFSHVYIYYIYIYIYIESISPTPGSRNLCFCWRGILDPVTPMRNRDFPLPSLRPW